MIFTSSRRFFQVTSTLLGVVLATPVFAQSTDTPEQTKNGTLIWHEPRSGNATKKPSQNSDAIIWNDTRGAATNRAAPASSGPLSPRSSGAPDRNGIIWNESSSATKNGAEKNDAANSVEENTVVPGDAGVAPYQANAAGPCREFDADIVIEGQRQPMRGTACRQPDGRWRVVSQVPR